MVILKRASGALAPARQWHLGGGKLTGHEEWVRSRLAENGDLTLNELCVALAGRGVLVDRSTVSRLPHRLGLSHKKSLQAAEQLRPQIARARDLWINRRKRFFNKALSQLIFIDETSTNTKLTRGRDGRQGESAIAPMLRSAHGRPRPSLPACAAMV